MADNTLGRQGPPGSQGKPGRDCTVILAGPAPKVRAARPAQTASPDLPASVASKVRWGSRVCVAKLVHKARSVRPVRAANRVRRARCRRSKR